MGSAQPRACNVIVLVRCFWRSLLSVDAVGATLQPMAGTVKRQVRAIGIVLLTLALLALAGCVAVVYDRLSLSAHATAEVIRVEAPQARLVNAQGSSRYCPVVRFTHESRVLEKELPTCQGNMGALNVGDRVEGVFDPDDPATVDEQSWSRFIAAAVLAVVAVLFGLGGRFFLSARPEEEAA